MDHQRGRSPSAGHQQAQYKPENSPSPQQFQEHTNSVGLGLGLDVANPVSNNQFLQTSFNSNSNSFLNPPGHFDQQGHLNDTSFNQNQNFSQQFKEGDQAFSQRQQPSFTELMGANAFEGDFPLFSNTSNQNDQLDPQIFMNDLSPQSGNPSINPAELNNMSSPPYNAPTPPSLLQPESRTSSSAHQSPSFNQGSFQPSPGHSRHASLGPESAAFPQGQHNMEWNNMMAPQFQGHRRTPSEYSDVSVGSAAPSPNLAHHDSFDPHHSPNLAAGGNDPMYDQVLSIGSFSLSDPQIQHSTPRRGLSPAHSPAISPRLGPQQLPSIHHQNPNQFMLGLDGAFNVQQQHYMGSHDSEYPSINHNGLVDMGQKQSFIPPPEINVEFAPNSRTNSFEPPKPSGFDQDALTPPERGRRRRAVSDPYNSGGSAASRPHTPSSLSPDIGSVGGFSEQSRSLSPNDRSGASSPSRRRQSTSALPHANRDYILGLADPEYAAQSLDNGGAKRVQKHPATFQCTLCPKRFTRAYNLRSHLRTHTDERPFVCTVCGKAFARQHDRKRHEGLHSGEKKFVCKGELKQGGQWGCGRRFARADALGRHFRSEAGRICIKPLLDEEAIERQRQWQGQHMHNMHMQQPQHLPMDANGFPMDASGNYTLPAALLAQYPALATLSWQDLPQGDHIDDDPSGRSSFDASGSEYYEEDDGGYISSGAGPQQGYGQGQMNETYSNGEYTSDVGQR